MAAGTQHKGPSGTTNINKIKQQQKSFFRNKCIMIEHKTIKMINIVSYLYMQCEFIHK